MISVIEYCTQKCAEPGSVPFLDHHFLDYIFTSNYYLQHHYYSFSLG